MLKRNILTLATLGVLVFALAACGGNNNDTSATTQTTQPETTTQTTQPDSYAEATSTYDENGGYEDYNASDAYQEGDIRGSWAGNVYTNPYLGITFTAPAGWEITTNDDLAEIFGLATDVLGLDALQTMGMFADMMAIDPETGNNVQVLFESLWGQNITEPEYIDMMVSAFEDFGGEVDVIPGTISLGNRNWYSYSTLLNMGAPVHGRQLLSISNDVAIMVIITYSDGAVNEILDMFGSL
ncbi:MAG: hypothetical protein FWB98_01065 [Defluviitaleaceae bacterium]|nr:hypothetical protein [Defluviitaleaceae bacterium]